MTRIYLAVTAIILALLALLYVQTDRLAKARVQVKALTEQRERDERASAILRDTLKRISTKDKEARNAAAKALQSAPDLRDTALPDGLADALRM